MSGTLFSPAAPLPSASQAVSCGFHSRPRSSPSCWHVTIPSLLSWQPFSCLLSHHHQLHTEREHRIRISMRAPRLPLTRSSAQSESDPVHATGRQLPSAVFFIFSRVGSSGIPARRWQEHDDSHDPDLVSAPAPCVAAQSRSAHARHYVPDPAGPDAGHAAGLSDAPVLTCAHGPVLGRVQRTDSAHDDRSLVRSTEPLLSPLSL